MADVITPCGECGRIGEHNSDCMEPYGASTPRRRGGKRKPKKPTEAEMAGMLAYIDASRKQQAETESKGAPGRSFTVYEDKLERWVRDLIREVKRLRRNVRK